MSITPVQLATNLFYINGAPLKMGPDVRHLYPIYNNAHNSLLLKFGRQTHKSTTISQTMVLPCIKYPNYHALYVAPTAKQVSVFSSDKLHSTIRGSDIIREHYMDTKTTDQIFYKEFSNNSKIYLRSAYQNAAESIRGISADKVFFDEIQDQLSDDVNTIAQTMSHSIAKYGELCERIPNLPAHLFNSKVYAGTPKTIENTLERYWANSTQTEWIIKCLHCNKHNYINEYNIGPTCLICNKCGKPIYYEDGQWISMNQKGFIHGYRLPQIVVNWINNRKDPRAWQVQVIETRASYSPEKFYNEVLALPYANAKNPLSPTDLMKVCKPYPMIDEPQTTSFLDKASAVFAGIDWGHGDDAAGRGTSFSILSIGAIIEGRFKLVFMKRYTGRLSDSLAQIEDMYELIRKYNVSFTMADWGDGRTSNAILVKRLSPRNFAEVYECGSQAKKIKWNKDKGIYTIDRTQIMTDRFMEIKNDQIDFFNYDQFEPFKLDFLNIYSEYSAQTRMTRYDHIGADDAFHSFMFCRLASMLINGELNKYLVGGESPADADDSAAVDL